MICELLGVPHADHDFFQENSRTITNRETTTEQRSAAIGNFAGHLNGLLDQKLANSGDDLLSGLVDRIEAEEITQREAAQVDVLPPRRAAGASGPRFGGRS